MSGLAPWVGSGQRQRRPPQRQRRPGRSDQIRSDQRALTVLSSCTAASLVSILLRLLLHTWGTSELWSVSDCDRTTGRLDDETGRWCQPRDGAAKGPVPVPVPVPVPGPSVSMPTTKCSGRLNSYPYSYSLFLFLGAPELKLLLYCRMLCPN